MSDPSVFGHHPDRPDVPEFWHLCDVVLQMDGKLEGPDERGDVFKETVEEIIPIEVLVYMSKQRSLRLLLPADMPEPLKMLFLQTMDPELIASLAAMYVDGFIAGAKYQERYVDADHPG